MKYSIAIHVTLDFGRDSRWLTSIDTYCPYPQFMIVFLLATIKKSNALTSNNYNSKSGELL